MKHDETKSTRKRRNPKPTEIDANSNMMPKRVNRSSQLTRFYKINLFILACEDVVHLLLGLINGSVSFFFRIGIVGRGGRLPGPGPGLAPLGPRGACINC